jgi:hypothetical protein
MAAFFFLIRAPHGLAINRDHLGRSAGQGRHPGDETLLELRRIQRGEEVAELVVPRRSLGKRPEPAQKVALLRAEAGDLDEALRPRQHRHKAQQQHLVERVDHLATLPRVRQRLKVVKEDKRLAQSPGRVHRAPFAESEAAYRFRTLPRCHALFPPDCPVYLVLLCRHEYFKHEILKACV